MPRMCARIWTIIASITLISFCTNAQAFILPSLPQVTHWQGGASYDYANSIWADMRNYFQLQDDAYQPGVQAEIRWYQNHQSYLYQILQGAEPYIYYIFQQTRQRNLPAELALLPYIESQYNPFAYSGVGAMGLWQMMPGTASGFGLKINWWYDGRRDVVASTRAALDYLTYLDDFFNNDWHLAIAAYDSGEGTVLDALRYNERMHRRTDFWNLPLPQETRNYLPKLLALAAIIKDPAQYGIVLPTIPDRPYFTAVNVHSQIDIDEAAKFAGVTISSIRKLNPGFRRWATDPGGPHTILVPVAKAKIFTERLNHLPKNDRVTWRHYIVKHRDSLDKIARHYKTSIAIIKQVNDIHSSLIHIGQNLLIPESYHSSIHSPILKEHATIAEVDVPGPRLNIYIAKPGDNLRTIARKFKLNVKQLRFWNNLTSEYRVAPGEPLTLWIQKFTHHYYKHFGIMNYKVRTGDSLIKIAKKFHTTVKELKRLNHIHNNIIRVKQNIKVPAAHHVLHHQMEQP